MAVKKSLQRRGRDCVYPCTKVVKFMTDVDLPANVGKSVPGYKNIDGYRHINIFVRYSQKEFDEPPVDLGVMFAFSTGGEMGSRRYVNLEENVAGPQNTNFIEVSGSAAWHGSQWKVSSYLARFPVMGPYAQVFVYNKAPVKRNVSVWAYLVS